jgi:hypothetical protein
MRCVITRGLPGSGKSTYIKNNYPDVVACSADNAFMKNGVYQYARSTRGRRQHKHLVVGSVALRRCSRGLRLRGVLRSDRRKRRDGGSAQRSRRAARQDQSHGSAIRAISSLVGGDPHRRRRMKSKFIGTYKCAVCGNRVRVYDWLPLAVFCAK